MARNVLFGTFLLFLILFGGSDASLRSELRRLVGADLKDSPSPAADPNSIDESGKGKTDPPSSTNTSQIEDSVGSNHPIASVVPSAPKPDNEKHEKDPNNTTLAAPPPVPKVNNEKSPDKEVKNVHQNFIHSVTSENCDDISAKCRDDGDIVACISQSDSKYLVVIIQNGGNNTVKVKLLTESDIGDIEVANQQSEKVNITLTSTGTTQLTLDGGKGKCVLHMGTHVPEGIFVRFPSYDKILTPVNGAYFLISAVVIFGAMWAFCKFRKKRHDGVPYQELEMALPESASATNVEVAEGWDQDWDDDWDEEVAVKSPGRSVAGSISANGLTARSSNRDGWENDWND